MRQVYISDILVQIRALAEVILRNGYPFYCFGFISQGVEFIGGISRKHLDKEENKDFDTGENYRYAIRKYFPKEYKRYLNKKEIDLYTQLRCGPVHSFSPGSKITLTNNDSANEFEKHLCYIKDKHGRELLVINADDYLKDFQTACDEVVKQLSKEGLNKAAYLSVGEGKSI